MLILSRYISETIRIGDDVSIKVLDVKGKQVRIGIDAPQEIEVHREEIYRRIQRERMQQAKQAPKVEEKKPKMFVGGANYYSSANQGGLGTNNPSKTPNVIVKKKRAFSLV